MAGKAWTEENLSFLKDNYSKYGSKHCSTVLGRTERAVYIKASRLSIPGPSKIKTHAQYISELPENYEVLEAYTKAHTSIIHRHTICGHVWMAYPNNILRGYGCPNCAVKAQTKTQEHYVSEMTEGYQVLELYKNAITPILHRHIECGYEWLVRPNDILSGHGCPNCAGNIKKTTEQYKTQIPKDYMLLEPYINYGTPILHKHIGCGYEWLASPSNILQGSRCPECAEHGFNRTAVATLYYICINEKYYKIGITGKTVAQRFSQEKDVHIRLVWSKEFEKGSEAFEMERTIKKEFKDVLGGHAVLKHGNTEIADHDFLQLDSPK